MFGPSSASRAYNVAVTAILVLTVRFAKFGGGAGGRAAARRMPMRSPDQKGTVARRVTESGEIETVRPVDLRKGDLVRVDRNETIPTDGEVVEGVAFVNESAITGESRLY